MFQIEEKIVKWIEAHMRLLAFVAVTFLSLGIRYSLRDFQSGDSIAFLLPWYEQIKAEGGLLGLKTQVGNYNMLYQFLIAVMTYLPVKPLHAYKILSVIFDYCLAAGVAALVYDVTDENREWKAFLAYVLVICSPLVFLNSSAWAQCDAIYTFFVIVSLYAFFKERYTCAFALYGMAFAFKLQAVFVLPFFLFVYFVKKKFSVLQFAFIPVMMCLSGIPCFLMGRNISEVFTVYQTQTSEWEKMSMNYPSIWTLLNDGQVVDSYISLKNTAIVLAVIVLGTIMMIWLVKGVETNTENMLYMAFLLAYTCVLILPAMHERYGFLYEILAIVIVFVNKKTIPLLISLNCISIATYGNYLYFRDIDMNLLAVVNLITYVCYFGIIMKRMLANDEQSEPQEREKQYSYGK